MERAIPQTVAASASMKVEPKALNCRANAWCYKHVYFPKRVLELEMFKAALAKIQVLSSLRCFVQLSVML